MYHIATQPAMAVADLLIWIIVGSPGLGWVAIVLTVAIGACLGGFGGVIGFAVQRALSRGSAGAAEAEKRE
jgi:Na+-transporting NADH:ubiquinone oxidoreductase subunit NqrD